TKALAKTPADRFASAGDFVRALEAGLKPAAPTVAHPAAAAPRRSRLTLAVAVVAVVADLGVAAVAIGAWAMRGRSTPVAGSQASLSSKTQLTVSGGIYYPAISPDGKQLAFVERHCTSADCTYSIVEQDVGGSTTRSILDGATAIYELRWSPDRRNLMMNGTIGGRFGSYMLSALGGPPRFLTSGAAAFYSDGDALDSRAHRPGSPWTVAGDWPGWEDRGPRCEPVHLRRDRYGGCRVAQSRRRRSGRIGGPHRDRSQDGAPLRQAGHDGHRDVHQCV